MYLKIKKLKAGKEKIMGISLARLDNRLLHGIVASQWTPKSGANRVMVIDDKTANTPMLKEAMRIGKPSGVSLSIINRETAYTNFKNGKYNGQKVFVVCNDPQIILDLIEDGNEIGTLILGGTEVPENTESIKVSKRAYVKKKDESVFKKIMEKGTIVLVQYVPNDKPEPLEKLI